MATRPLEAIREKESSLPCRALNVHLICRLANRMPFMYKKPVRQNEACLKLDQNGNREHIKRTNTQSVENYLPFHPMPHAPCPMQFKYANRTNIDNNVVMRRFCG
jgi:hypothetical protein